MKYHNTHKYDDIIRLPHPVSKRHTPMPLLSRAAQFSPFAALTGHNEAIEETSRLTDSFIELDEDEKIRLNEKLRLIKENIDRKPEIEVTYFQPDERKTGGTYVTICSRVKRIDEYNRRILFMDGKTVRLESLFSIHIHCGT